MLIAVAVAEEGPGADFEVSVTCEPLHVSGVVSPVCSPCVCDCIALLVCGTFVPTGVLDTSGPVVVLGVTVFTIPVGCRVLSYLGVPAAALVLTS